MKSIAAGRSGATMRKPVGSAEIFAPDSRSLTRAASRSSGRAFFTSTSPPVIIAAASSVPASMRSGIAVSSVGRSDCTPSMVITLLPAPCTRAPMALSIWASAVTSGSRAQFSSTVRPSASTAAIIRFSVPVTVGRSKRILAPCKRPAFAST